LWLKDLSEIKGDNLTNVTCEESRHFRIKKREYLKGKLINLQQTVTTRTLLICIEE
jgi:hypothetical protein